MIDIVTQEVGEAEASAGWVHALVEEDQSSRTVAIQQYGAWMKWQQAMAQNDTWQDIWKWSSKRVKSLIQGSTMSFPDHSA